MGHPTIETSNQVINHQQVTLLELLDRLLDKGVMVKGEVLLSVADVDLVYLNLGLLLSSVKTIEQAATRESSPQTRPAFWPTTPQPAPLAPPPLPNRSSAAPPRLFSQVNNPPEAATGELLADVLPSTIDHELGQLLGQKAAIDPKNVEKGLTKLVLTLVDLVRKLMEKQTIRRIEAGQLQASEIDRMGETFLLLDQKMDQLKETFGLTDEDLNIDLGPLGKLL